MAKVEQDDAGYDRGDPIDHCGVCVNYTGNACSKVAGDISPFGRCQQFYKPEPNPFGKTLVPPEIAAIKAMAADASDRSGGTQPNAPQPVQPMQRAAPTPPQPMPPQRPPQPQARPFFG